MKYIEVHWIFFLDCLRNSSACLSNNNFGSNPQPKNIFRRSGYFCLDPGAFRA
ncbi:MAG: hypothetical protein ACPKQO_08580 [Nitrososphaeraceae archaeon]